MEWINQEPDKSGEYIVKTESYLLKKKQVLLAHLTVDDKGNKSWNFNRQKFIAYLKD